MKNKLTENQKEFLLKNFFQNEKYAGWKGIATTLLEEGSCIVAGKNCIWVGGIGNFIKTREAENAIDCTLYEFNLKEFLSSAWYKEIHQSQVDALAEKKRVAEQAHEEIISLTHHYYGS